MGNDLFIVGHEKTSFIDYPDKICTMYFLGGCNFLCPYCHNAHVVHSKENCIRKEEVFAFLKRRKKFVDSVCISGGEPTIHKGLYEFIYQIKVEGFLVKLDTNGTNPSIIQRLINEKLIDYIAMDIKGPLSKYEKISNTHVNMEYIKRSIDIIRNSHIDYEFRTTVCKELLTKEDILEIAKYLKDSKKYILQNFRDGETVLGGKNVFHPYELGILEDIKKEIEGYFEIFKIR
ncbi:anaerobic ribonucleoside-triphosphate reductase activating protein [Inediibacterium massiliense]|uniref:anaerobic ribonucleoside-triphosphate reductase activating protein n=1 Tax=Inediibacterium massiliense TaxID=1658111 RepID=UPI000A6E8F0D|nr:anaerobic ribonucleoside-triphosphate reductase activating protein [Inediibacterium massiliense]